MTSAELNRLMAKFRSRFSPMHPVQVRRESLGGHCGDTSIVTRKGESYFLVRIEKKLGTEAQVFCLWHELGHVLQWRINEEERENDHDAEWGICLAAIWSALFGS